jgi:sulfite exporter TauE/SafE
MGVLYMALFGLGTVPIMFVTSVAGNFISIGIRQKITKIIPILAIILALLFILRGMNLGIMYISPKTEKMMKVIPAEHLNHDSLKTKDCCK